MKIEEVCIGMEVVSAMEGWIRNLDVIEGLERIASDQSG